MFPSFPLFEAEMKPFQAHNPTSQPLQIQNNVWVSNNPTRPTNYPNLEMIASWQNPNGNEVRKRKRDWQNGGDGNAYVAGEEQSQESSGGESQGSGSVSPTQFPFGMGNSNEEENQRREIENAMRIPSEAERRYKRMIRNRESAARSRARKQAYTAQLEIEIQQLRMENAWLHRRRKVLEDITAAALRQLRRIPMRSYSWAF